MTKYQELKKKVVIRRGRTPLTAEERQERTQTRKMVTRRRVEAKRRALFVLEHKYNGEFKELFTEEFDALKKDTRYQYTH